MTDRPSPERYVDRWERTEVTGDVTDQGHRTGRPVIVHRRPESHVFLVHSLAGENPGTQEVGDDGLDPGSLQCESQAVNQHKRQTWEVLQQEIPSRDEKDEAGDFPISWTTTWEGVDGESPTCVQERTELKEGVEISVIESSTQDSDIAIRGQSEFTEKQPHSSEFSFSIKDFKAEEAFMIGVDSRELPTETTSLVDDISSVASVIPVDREGSGVDKGNSRIDKTYLKGLESEDTYVVSREDITDKHLTVGVDMESSEFRREEAFMIGVDMCDRDGKKSFIEDPVSIDLDLDDVDVDRRGHKAADIVYDDHQSDNDNADDEEAGEDGGPVRVLRRIERSFSIGEDGRKSQVTDRLLERRKTIEVDKEDLSGVEAIHTSSVNITIGGEMAGGGESHVSELNIIWGKTVEADLSQEQSPLVASPVLTSPREDASSVGDTDTCEYWSGDVSTDTVRSSGSFDTYVDTGDSMYASDPNNSPDHQGLEHSSYSDKPTPPPRHSTPRASRGTENSEATHYLWEPELSPLQPRSVTVLEVESGQVVTISGQPNNLTDLETEQAHVSPRPGHDNKYVSTLDIVGGKTVVVAESRDKDSRSEQESDDPDNRGIRSARSLYKNTGDIVKLEPPREQDAPVVVTDAAESSSRTGDGGIRRVDFVDRREEYLEPYEENLTIVRKSRSAIHSLPNDPPSLTNEPPEVSVTGAKEDKMRESPDGSQTFEDGEFVPVRGKKKKKFRKKKKKEKTVPGDVDTVEDTSATGPQADENLLPLPDSAAWPVPGVASHSVTRPSDGSGEMHKELDKDKNEFQESENTTTFLSEEENNVALVRDIAEIEGADSKSLKIDSPSHGVFQDSEPIDSIEKTSEHGEDKTPSFLPQSDYKDPDEQESPPSSALQAQDYLTEILQGAAVDPETLLLHSEGQDGDVLLNVSKGRRRILRPHRRFTKDRGGREETESQGVGNNGQMKISTSAGHEEAQHTDESGVERCHQPYINDTKEHRSEEVRIEDGSDKGELKERKRSVDGNLKDIADFGSCGDINVDTASGETVEISLQDDHEIYIDGDSSNNNEEKESSMEARDYGIIDFGRERTANSPTCVFQGDTDNISTGSDNLPAHVQYVAAESSDSPKFDDSLSGNVGHDTGNIVSDEGLMVHVDDTVISTHNAEHHEDDIELVSRDMISDQYTPTSTMEYKSTEQDGSGPSVGSSLDAHAVADLKEDTDMPVDLPQQADDNPLTWPKKGKKKKHKKKNKKDRQAQDLSKATKESGAQDEAKLVQVGDDSTQEGGDHDKTDNDAGTKLSCQHTRPRSDVVDTSEIDTANFVSNLPGQRGQENDTGVKDEFLLSQENEPSPADRDSGSGGATGGEYGDPGSNLDEELSVNQSVDRVELFYDGPLDRPVTVHRARDPNVQTGECVPKETFLTVDYMYITDVVVASPDGTDDVFDRVGGPTGVDSSSLDTSEVEDTEAGVRETVAIYDTCIGGKPSVAVADSKIYLNVETTSVGANDTVFFDASTVGDDTVYVDATNGIGNESLEIDDGRKLDELIKDLVSDVDLVSLRDIRIYIEDDLVKRVDDILSNETRDETDSQALSKGECEGQSPLVQSGDDHVSSNWTLAEQNVDRREEFEPVLSKRLLEDVVSNRARAQEVATRDPEAGYATLTSGTELTAGGHLLSEMALLETAAREQADSLKLAVAQQTTYEAQLQQLNTAISEAQGKLLSSPVMASSVSALKQQMAEHDDLASQIKHYQNSVNEITEKNRELVLDSAHLSPKLFRKHYLPGSAYDDYFSAAQIHHRVGSPLPVSSPLFYDTLPTFQLEAPPVASTGQAGDRNRLELPTPATSNRKQTSLSDAPALSLDLPRKIPPPRKDTIPRPTWSDSTPNQTSLGKHAPGQSPGASQNKSGFFQQSEAIEAPGESVSTSGYATAPSSARSVGAGAAPSVNRQDHTLFSSIAATESGPKLSFKTNTSDKTPKTFKEAANKDCVLGPVSNQSPQIVPQRYASTAAFSPSPVQEIRRQPAEVTAELSPSSSRHTTSVDSGLDTGTNVSLTSGLQPRQTSPARSVSSVVERLAAAMAAGAPSRPPPAGARPTELLRMGGSVENISSPRSPSARSESVDSLVHQRSPLGTSKTLPRDSSTHNSFQSLLSSPRVAPPGAATQQQELKKPSSAIAGAPWKSVSESNLATTVKSPRFGDASATSTPRLALDQVITGTAVVNAPGTGTRDVWADLDLDVDTRGKLAPTEDVLSKSTRSAMVKQSVSPPDFSQATVSRNPPISSRDVTQAFRDLSMSYPSSVGPTIDSLDLDSLSNPIPSASVPHGSKIQPPTSKPTSVNPNTNSNKSDFLSVVKDPQSPPFSPIGSSDRPKSKFLLSRSKNSLPCTKTSSPAQRDNPDILLSMKVSKSQCIAQPTTDLPVSGNASPTRSCVSSSLVSSTPKIKSPSLVRTQPVSSTASASPSSPQTLVKKLPSSHRVTSLSVTEDRIISVSAFSPLAVPTLTSPFVLLSKSRVDQASSTNPAVTGTRAAWPSTSKRSLTAVVRLGGAVGRDVASMPGLTPLRSRGTVQLVAAKGDGEARERSSSFNTSVESLGRPLGEGRDSKVKDASWATLQEQAQSKERELQAALQRQERYQQSVQQLTAKMERCSVQLGNNPASMAAPLDTQVREFKETLAEIDDIRSEIGQARERGEQLMDSPNSEGGKALQSTLTMLEDRFRSLQALADDKGRQLQEAKTHKERHAVERAAYEKRVAELREWLEEAKVRHVALTLPSDDPARLQEQVDQSKDIQAEVNVRLRQVSDLALQCDSVCEHEPPSQAERLRNQLAQLQKELGDLKMSTIEKQAELRGAIKDSEKRRREREEVDTNVARLQKWMTDTKEMTKPSETTTVSIQPDIHKDLVSDIKQHRQLVRQISDRKLRTAPPAGLPAPSDREVRDSWERLSRHLAQKRDNLQAMLSTSKPGELVKISLHAPTRQADSANQLSEVKSIMGDMSTTWRELQTQLDEKKLSLDEAMTFQQQYQSALQGVSSWLDLAQQQLFTVPSTTEEHIRHNENLQKQLKTLQAEVMDMSDQGEELLTSTDPTNRDLVEACLTSLDARLQLLAESAQGQADDLRAAERDWRQYQDELKQLKARLQDTQKLLLVQAPAGSSLDAMVENNQKIEAQLKKCELQLSELKTKEASLTLAYPKGVFPSELATLHSNYLDLNRRAMEKRAILQQSTSVQDQYQKMLNDYSAFLNTAQDKLRTDVISARDLTHLRQQLASHKDFFSDLEVHQAMLTALADQCDTATKTRLQAQHAPLMSLTHVLVDQASLHGQRLERLTRQWAELEQKHGRLTKVLSSLKSQVPRPVASGDSLTTIQDKLGKYKRLQMELAEERASVFEVVDKGKQILHSVNCPTLESVVTSLADMWVDLNTDLTHELKRTETLGDQLSIFETEAAVLTSWLAAAKTKLNSFKQLSTSDLSNIGAVRTKVEKLLEFRKEIENQAPLRDRVLKAGQKLLLNQNYDTRGLSDRLDNYKSEWRHLENGAAKAGEFLHERQMELMPSRQAMTELTSWINQINKSLEEDAKRRVKSVADIEVMVKKYKGYRVEVTSKQMTLDFVNQSVLAPQPEDEHVTHEKLDFADKLGEVNKNWVKVVKAINDRLASLEGVNGQWLEYEQALERLQAWFREQEDKVKRYKLIGHEVGVRQTLKDCKTLQQQLKAKQADMTAVTSLGQKLVELSRESPGCQQSVRDSLESLQNTWTHLEEQTRQLENLLTDMLGQWARYHTDLASLNQMLTQIEYALSQYTLIGGDIHTLRSQVGKLKKLQSEQQASAGHLEAFSNLSGQLRQVCEPPVQLDLQKTVADVQARWKQVAKDLADRLSRFDGCLALWQSYEDKHSHLLAWLDSREALCSGLITLRDDPDKQTDALARGKNLQQELDKAQGQLAELYRLSDQLTGTMDPSTIATLTARQSGLEQRMMALRQVLQQHLASLTDDLSMLGRFNQAYQVVEKFLNYAGQILAPADPGKSDEEAELQNRLDQLRQLLLLFNTNYVKLDDVNELGYRLALKDADAKRLLDLNHRWQDLYEDANERSRSLQGHLLVQQDFTAKCEAWMTFLAHTETDLAREIKGNLRDLQEQLRGCEQFESEMYSNQQILHAIINDGQKMMRAGEVDDVEEFQQKLQLLSEQWHSVTQRANQRRAIIEGLIAKWQEFNANSEQLKAWLQDKQCTMAALEFDSDSLQVIRHLSEKVKMTQHEFELHEATFKRIHDLGSVLQQHADQAASREIKSTLTDLEQLWTRVFSGLDDQRVKLEGVDRQWLDCEDDICEILAWLQDIRQVLYADIPSTHDAIQEEINKCRDITSSFASAEDKRQSLLSRERRLGRLVQTEDMNLLHQRIRLLNKQWEELRHQAVLREHRLTEALFRWTNLGERLRALMVWIEQMESKITSTGDMHVEDLLAKLENEYKIEMNEKEVEKKEVVSQGKQLMKVSSEIRASDIEQKILRLEDKWSHLVSVMDFRLRKLQETVLAVKQLDTSMKNLSRWLSQVENQLSGGLEFNAVGLREIQAKLQDTQELQEDIEQHSAGVSAVLNLCEVLLHDHDACPTQTEFLALQHAMKNLEKRWRNICNLSPRRRTRVEETWELWEQFRTDCQLFSDWLSQIEKEVRESEIEVRDVALAKQEISKYERLQRNVHDHLAQLENINRQYRQLAKDGRTDTDGQLRVVMTDLNNRWDAVQIKVTEIMKKLRHSATIRQDFEETRTSLISWLREVDNQLTDILHSTDLDLDAKVEEIRRIEDEVHTKRHRMDYLDQAGVYLMQKGDSQEALTVQAQLEDFRLLSSQVLERVVTTQLQVERLVVEQQVEDVAELEKVETSRRHQDSSADRIRELRDAQTTVILERQTAELERYLEESPPESPPMLRRQDASPSRVTVPASRYSHSPVRPAAQHSASQSPIRSRPTPASAASAATPATDTSIRSRSPSKVVTPRPRASGSPVRRMSPSPSRRSPLSSRFRQDVTDSSALSAPDIGQLERSAKLEVLMEQLVEGLDDCNLKLARLEQSLGSRSGCSALDQQLQLLVECEVAVDGVTRLHRLLKTESGVSSIASADAQVQLITKRWELLQRRAMEREMRLSHQHHDLSKLEVDVDALLAWLDEAEALQASLRSLPEDIGQLDRVVRQYKDFLVQLESRKPTVLSINLLSRAHLSSRSPDTKSLRVKVQEMNRRWELVLARAEEIQIDIQTSLLRCQEFHHTIDNYQDWLESLETRVRQLEPLNLNQEEAALWSKYTVLVDTHSELQRNQSKVLATKETADQLLVTSDSPNMCAARDSIHSIHKRMRSLMHLTAAYISSLENKLNIRPTRGSASSSLDLSEGRSSGLGSSHASRSSTPLRPSSSALRTRARSPFAVSRQLLAGIFGPLLRSAALLQPYNSNTVCDENSVAESETTGPSRLLRVLRAALPIQLLLLLLLLLACIVPVCEDEHSCLLSNNLRHSFSPMLHYTDGAPPT